MKRTISNHFDTLFTHFKEAFQGHLPFEKHALVVPSFATANYVKEKLASELGICMGLRTTFLQPLIKKLVAHFYPQFSFRSPLDQALLVEKQIEKILNLREALSEDEKEVYAPLEEYLSDSAGKRVQNRLVALSDSLGAQFQKYGLYSDSLKEDWRDTTLQDWQQGIWKEIASDPLFLTDFRCLLESEPNSQPYPEHLYFFGFNFIPKIYLDLLQKLSPNLSLHIYQLSPSRHFWTDIQSPFEKSAYVTRLKKEKASAMQIEELSNYLYEMNPLLSSLGKLSRETFRWFEEQQDSVEEYVLPQSSLEFEEYAEAHLGLENTFVPRKMSALSHIQMDILSLRRPREVYSLSESDSIGVHRATTIEREVEILYDSLLDLFEQDKNLKMDEVMVLTAGIEDYIPYIESVFLSKNSPFQIALHDYPASIRNAPLRGLFLLIDLVKGRWDKKSLFALFEHPLFKKKFNLSSDEIEKWDRWTEALKVEWGKDKSHQSHILEKEYSLSSKDSQVFHWEDFFKEMLSRFSKPQSEDLLSYSLSKLDFSDASPLNRLIELMTSLDRDLEPLRASEASFACWANYLSALLETYFKESYEEDYEIRALLQRMQETSKISEDLQKETFSFETYWYHLRKDLSVFHMERYGQQSGALSFYSLYSRPVRSAKVVCVLGLQDETFPRNPLQDPLFRLSDFSKSDYCPKTLDEDRYQFLELLLLANEKLYLSYLGYSAKNHKEQLPSVLITELLSYLDRFYEIDGQKPSERIHHHHPSLKFDASYFAGPNKHLESYFLATSFYNSEKNKPISPWTQRINDTILLSQKAHAQKEMTISLQKLMQFVRNPIEVTLNARDQIYFDDGKWENSEQNFILTPLQKAILKKRLFRDETLTLKDASLPKGLYRFALDEQLEEDLSKSEHYLQKDKIDKEDLLTIELREDIKEPIPFSKRHHLYPAIKVRLSESFVVKVTGLIEGFSDRGLFLTSACTFENIWCNWPALLAASLLPTSFNSCLYFMGSQRSRQFTIESPEQELRQFISYYLLGQDQLCPFLPEWIVSWTQERLDRVREKILRDVQSDFFNRVYIKKLFNPRALPKEQVLESWQELSRLLFSKTLQSIGSK